MPARSCVPPKKLDPRLFTPWQGLRPFDASYLDRLVLWVCPGRHAPCESIEGHISARRPKPSLPPAFSPAYACSGIGSWPELTALFEELRAALRSGDASVYRELVPAVHRVKAFATTFLLHLRGGPDAGQLTRTVSFLKAIEAGGVATFVVVTPEVAWDWWPGSAAEERELLATIQNLVFQPHAPPAGVDSGIPDDSAESLFSRGPETMEQSWPLPEAEWRDAPALTQAPGSFVIGDGGLEGGATRYTTRKREWTEDVRQPLCLAAYPKDIDGRRVVHFEVRPPRSNQAKRIGISSLDGVCAFLRRPRTEGLRVWNRCYPRVFCFKQMPSAEALARTFGCVTALVRIAQYLEPVYYVPARLLGETDKHWKSRWSRRGDLSPLTVHSLHAAAEHLGVGRMLRLLKTVPNPFVEAQGTLFEGFPRVGVS